MLPPPRHPALGFAPQAPNLMLVRAEPQACMPPWCPLLAAAVGTDSCARLAWAQQRAAHLLPAFFAGRVLGEPAPVPPIGGTGATRPAKKKPICTTTSVAQAARPPGLPPPRHPALGLPPQTPNLMPARYQRLMGMPLWCPLLAATEGRQMCVKLAGHGNGQCICYQRSLREGAWGNRHRFPQSGAWGRRAPQKRNPPVR